MEDNMEEPSCTFSANEKEWSKINKHNISYSKTYAWIKQKDTEKDYKTTHIELLKEIKEILVKNTKNTNEPELNCVFSYYRGALSERAKTSFEKIGEQWVINTEYEPEKISENEIIDLESKLIENFNEEMKKIKFIWFEKGE